MRDTAQRTFMVAASLCLVCSVLVSSAAVILRPAQQRNQQLDIQKNILTVSGQLDEAQPIDVQFRKNVEAKLIDLKTGTELSETDLKYAEINLTTYDARKAAKVAATSTEVSPAGALPQIARRELYSLVYQVKKEDGTLDQVVLPIYGKGLWSTLYGFIAVEADGVTIRGITFYEHGETPGLGGEVDNPGWKATWEGKKAFGELSGDGIATPVIEVLKGSVDKSSASATHQVDGLSGATITSRGVSLLVQYWLGADGFGPYLKTLQATTLQEAAATEGEK
jgi:Na+-transporting NADH:ubiquinone oxidoreductase subunit C